MSQSEKPFAVLAPSTFRKGLSILSSRERRRGAALLMLIVTMAIIEAASVVSILPFLSVVSDPAAIQQNTALRMACQILDEPTVDEFVFYMGIGTFCVTLLAALLRSLTHYAINCFTQMRLRSISVMLIKTYLRQPYEFFFDRHSGDMSTRVLSEAVEIVETFYRPALNMCAGLVTLLAIVSVLVAMDPLTAAVSAIIFGGAYGVIYLGTHDFLKRSGHQRTEANKRRFATAANIFTGIKTIKVAGAEEAFLQQFDTDSLIVARRRAITQTLSQVPRFAIEAIAIGGIVLLCLVLIARSGGVGGDSVATVLPVLGLYGFAGYRLVPAFQQIFAAAASFRMAGAAIDSVYADVAERSSLPNLTRRSSAPLPLRDALTFELASYRYPNAARPSIDDLSLTITAGARIGVVGSTGAGKTTFVDLLLGALLTTSGEVCVDGVALDDQSVRAWQRNVGYVPQEIFLVDASIIQNVAFEFSGASIDEARVVQCLRAARLYDFVMTEMPDGLQTRVGERGVRMSGGQRQRLGIARALYHDPAMLILDEATSALDNVTEMEVMEAITELSRTKTVVMVAHRLSSLRDCETILLLKQGRLEAVGSYDTLLRESEDFHLLAELT